MEEARPEIYALTNSSESLPYSAVQAIAWFQDPATYPRLRLEFEKSPSVSSAAFLESLPGMGDTVKTIAARQWRRDRLVMREPGQLLFGESFRLALRQGDPTALERIYQVLDISSNDRMNTEWYLTSSLADGIDMRGLKPQNRHNSDAVLAWLRQHRPEEFVFNAARRQFVLKNP